MAKKRTYQDDDGRTIADMSGIEPSPMLFPRFPGRKKEQSRGPETPAQDRPWETAPQYTDEERRAAMGGALGGMLGMLAFRHKTKHKSFVIGMPLLLLLNIVCIAGIICLAMCG